MKKVLVILGPTATGKTDLALSLAKKFNGELVACDSRQVYQGLDVGTGKMPGGDVSSQPSVIRHNNFWEIDGIKIWMYDVVEVGEQYHVQAYVEAAKKVIENIFTREKLPVIVGGTGLYLRALLDGMANLAIPDNPDLRKELDSLNLEQLQKRLLHLSPAVFGEMNNSDVNNPRRLIRKIELVTMNPYINDKMTTAGLSDNLDILKIGLTTPRPLLYQKINARVLTWISDGLIDEVKKLISGGVSSEKIKALGLEYRLVMDYLEGKIKTEAELVWQMQNKTRQYAKRQITWFKKMANINWLDISDPHFDSKVEKLTSDWYNLQDE